MLSDIAAEVLHFLTRRDLDKACAVSKWLDAMIAQCCDGVPLRPVYSVRLFSCWDGFGLKVCVGSHLDSWIDQWFCSLDDALRFAGAILRHSHIKVLHVSLERLLCGSAGTSLFEISTFSFTGCIYNT